MKQAGQIALIVISALLLFLLGEEFGRERVQRAPIPPLKEKADTLYLRDTITLDKPVFVTKHKIDSVLVPADSVVTLHDTLFVLMERSQEVWQDSLSVVYASGILPRVDSVKHFTSSKVVTITREVPYKVRSRWGVGIQTGYGASGEGLFPYVGVGLSYNLLSW